MIHKHTYLDIHILPGQIFYRFPTVFFCLLLMFRNPSYNPDNNILLYNL